MNPRQVTVKVTRHVRTLCVIIILLSYYSIQSVGMHTVVKTNYAAFVAKGLRKRWLDDATIRYNYFTTIGDGQSFK